MNPPRSADRPLVIGLLGGIAAGKSTVGRFFAEHGFRVIDADRIARDVVDDPDCRSRIVHRFGPGVLRPDGTLRRGVLAELVFADAGARTDLEDIVLPEVRRVILAGLAAASSEGVSVILDAPLLLERGLISACDHNVFLDATDAVRRDRAKARGWAEGELERREATQAPLADKRARCQFTIRTDESIAATRDQVDAIVAAGWQPGGSSPDSAAPGSAAPDSAAPDSAAPDSAAPDSG